MGEDYTPMNFRINSDEVKVLNEWMGYIYEKHKKYGNFDYKFKNNNVGKYEVWVYNDLEKSELCLTSYNKQGE